MDFIRSHFGKMQLWRVEHFFPPFFSRSMLIGGKFIFTKKSITRFAFQCNFNQSALIWKKTGEKSVQLVRVSLFRKYFLWNPYFSKVSSQQYVYRWTRLQNLSQWVIQFYRNNPSIVGVFCHTGRWRHR